MLPPVVLADRFLFGCLNREVTLREWRFLFEFDCRIDRNCELNRLLRRAVPSFEIIMELRHAKEAWNLYDDIAYWSDEFDRTDDMNVRRECVICVMDKLARLRAHIGWRDFYAGRLPPVQWFRELDAVMNAPLP
jgi:hypothetical protein